MPETELLTFLGEFIGNITFLSFTVYLLITERNAHEKTRQQWRDDTISSRTAFLTELEKFRELSRSEAAAARHAHEATVQESSRQMVSLMRDVMMNDTRKEIPQISDAA